MMHLCTRTGRSLAGLVLFLVGLNAYGCGDTGTQSQPAELGSLSTTAGILEPKFNPATTAYTVKLFGNETSTTITVSPRVAGDSIRINNQARTSQAVTLTSIGTNEVLNIVVTDTGVGNTSKSYTVRVSREEEDTTLQALSSLPGTVAPSPFDKTELEPSINGVGSSVTSIRLTATKSDSNTVMVIDIPTNPVTVPAGTAVGEATVQLGGTGSSTKVPITITGPKGGKSTYQVTINRGASDNAFLGSLSISPVNLKDFKPSNTLYEVSVPSGTDKVTVTGKPQDATASMKILVNGVEDPQPPIQLLGPGQTTPITVHVTAQDGKSQQDYVIRVKRDALAGNNNLQSLAISPGTLDPSFTANTTSYTVAVPNTLTSVTVTPRLQDASATITVNGQATNSGQARTVALNGAGSNTLVNIVVTAQNGTQKTYTANVARAALGGNNNLQSLAVSPGALDPAFAANTTSYTVDVASSVASITVTPTRQDPAATITVNGQPTNSGQGPTITLNGAGSNTLVNILVTAQNGSQKNYAVNVSRAALGSNNNLSAMSVSPGTLSPTFRADRVAYTVNVGSTINSLTVTATVQDAGASLTMNGQGASSGQPRSIPLDQPGTTTEINVVVNAPNGNPKTYQLDVIREALGGNNNLQNLSVSPDSLAPTFSASTVDYTVSVPSDVSSVTVTPTLQDTNATMTVNGQGSSSGQAITIPLGAEGSSTSVAIVVTAPNGSQKSYGVTINRAAPAAKPATPTVAPDLIPEDDSCEPNLPLNPNECFPPTSREDNITAVKRPKFGIPPPATGTPSLYVDTNKDTSASFDSGTNTLRPSANLSDGDHTITYTLTNAGGESDPSPALTVTINTTAPVQ
ncbi:exported hypothetical protein [Candidatus Nitrospira nitrosa]|uniref:Cadherin-like beta sandwich domain-containing protein n=1 Tax=Candidatus Nitrospira nitrosa TaxID=1742972 RepID=A0A0S4LE20_9BACT|nr:cadherin-like beta sandwich domain-containing protein [Candidatus Nitrospira nitrosa]CUS35863.1 exported hypothetical protein [Candidatus Nitrospira nitrosa]